MVREIIIPQLGVNDEFVTIVEWHVNDGDKVGLETPLCLIETSKATTELVAERAGFVRITKKAGQEAEINEVVGYIVSSLDIEIKEELPVQPQTELKESTISSRKKSIKATKKAKELARSLGINLELLDKKDT